MRILFVFALVAVAAASIGKPEQLHLSLTERDGEMRVMWVRPTLPLEQAPADEQCVYGKTATSLTEKAVASSHTYADGGFKGSIYNAVLSVPEHSTEYFYQCGSVSEASMSTVYSFKTPPAPMTEETVKVACFGDMGTAMPGVGRVIGRDSSLTQKRMNTFAEQKEIDVVVNVGDSSYANDIGRIRHGRAGNNSYIYDDYFNQIEPTIARAPMMLCPGNHESEYSFSPYLNRTMMPVQGSGPLARFYNSWDYGPIHFVTFSTEHDISEKSEQWQFVLDDLSSVNRTLTPWVVAFSHHPMYCADLLLQNSRCGSEAQFYRASMEPLFYKYGVDLYLAGHNHNYEASFPTYQNAKVQNDWKSAKATTYIVNGAAGDLEGIEGWGFNLLNKQHANGVWGFDTGFMRMNVNRTTMDIGFESSYKNKMIEKFTMTK